LRSPNASQAAPDRVPLLSARFTFYGAPRERLKTESEPPARGRSRRSSPFRS